jgi:hypothetical protein
MEIKPPEKQDPKTPAQQTDAEAQWARYEEFIAEISKRLRPEPAKPRWQKLLESAGGVALITVIIGGLLGQLISMYIQASLRDRDYEQTISKAQNDRDLADYTKFLDQGSETVKHVYGLVGTCVSASDDLIQVASDELNQEVLAPDERKKEVAQKLEKRKKFNAADDKWREERDGLGLLMRYYHHNEDGVTVAWQGVQESTTSYMDCARAKHKQYYAPDDPNDPLPICQVQRHAVLRALDALAQSVESNRKTIGVSHSR